MAVLLGRAAAVFQAAQLPPDLRVAAVAAGQFQRPVAPVEAAQLPVCTEKLSPRVVMVKSGQDGVRTYGPGSLSRPRIRRIFV
jgi:hypothetical protein